MTRTFLAKPWEVLAIRSGRKSMIARPAVPRPAALSGSAPPGLVGPLGSPGDVLLGKEAWQRYMEDEVPAGHPHGPRDTMGRPSNPEIKSHIYYRADGELIHPDQGRPCWYPAQHMPPWAVRLRLIVEAVTAKRCTEITEDEAKALGSPLVSGAFYHGTWAKERWNEDFPRHPWESSWAWLATVRREG